MCSWTTNPSPFCVNKSAPRFWPDKKNTYVRFPMMQGGAATQNDEGIGMNARSLSFCTVLCMYSLRGTSTGVKACGCAPFKPIDPVVPGPEEDVYLASV